MPTQQELAQQAYAAWTGSPMVPLAGGMDPADPLAQQDAALAAQAAQDAQMAAAGPPAPAPAPAFVDPASVSSMPPEMSPAPPEPTPQQQLAAAAYRAWSPSAPPLEGFSGWQPPPEEAGPPAPPAAEPKVIAVPEQEISAEPPAARAGGPARPSLLTEQGTMAGASRDAADQARVDADISTDVQAGLTEVEGEQRSETAKLMAARATQQQADLEEAGKQANERRAVKEAAAADVQAQYKKLSDEAANVQVADRRTTSNRVMGALGMALAGMGDAIAASGGNKTNFLQTTVGLINEAVDRDLAIQRDNLANKKDAAAAKYTELGLARDSIKDVDAQEAAARAALMDKYALGLDSIKAQGLGETATTTAALAAEQIRGSAAQLRAQTAEQQAAKDEDRLWTLQVQREQERKAAAAAKARAAVKAPQVSELEQKLADGSITAPEMKMLNDLRQGVLDNEKKQRALNGGDGQSTGNDVPGGLRIVRPEIYAQLTDLQKRKIQEAPAAANKLIGLLDDIAKKREENEYTRGVPWTNANEELSGYEGQLTGALKEAEELGALDNGVIRLVQQTAGSATAIRDAPGIRLQALRAVVAKNMRDRALGYGLDISPRTPFTGLQGATLEQLTEARE